MERLPVFKAMCIAECGERIEITAVIANRVRRQTPLVFQKIEVRIKLMGGFRLHLNLQR
jgi:hypothetical protein